MPGRGTRVSHAEGAYLYLEDGSKILDAAGGAIVANIGHGRRRVADAIHEATINCSYAVPPWITPEREGLVDELTEHWLPDHLERLHLTCGGSEANESAIKMAIQYHAGRGNPDRNIILARDISYHGTTITMAAMSGHPGRKRGLESILAEYPRIPTPYPLRCPLGPHHPDAANYYLGELEKTIEGIGAERIAALMAEPMNGSSGGAIAPPDDYWARAQKLLKDKGILLIMDEVMTGFGRTGARFGSDLFEIEPDILVAGKGMAGGYAAIAGVYARPEIADGIRAGGFDVMFHTFGALPQSCAAATEVLKILREENLVERAHSVGAQLKARLHEAFDQHPLVAEVRGEGLLLALEIVEDRQDLIPFPKEAGVTNKVVGYGLANGVFFYPGGNGEIRDIICMGPPFIIGDQEIDLMIDTLEKALALVST